MFYQFCWLLEILIFLFLKKLTNLAFYCIRSALHFQRYLKKYWSQRNGSVIIWNLTSRRFQRVVLHCCTIIIKPTATKNVFWLFFLVHPLFVCLSIYPMYLSQRFGSVIFFTDPDPDPTQKPKADPDPDPGKSTSISHKANCLEAIFDRKTIIITRIRIRHLWNSGSGSW